MGLPVPGSMPTNPNDPQSTTLEIQNKGSCQLCCLESIISFITQVTSLVVKGPPGSYLRKMCDAEFQIRLDTCKVCNSCPISPALTDQFFQGFQLSTVMLHYKLSE